MQSWWIPFFSYFYGVYLRSYFNNHLHNGEKVPRLIFNCSNPALLPRQKAPGECFQKTRPGHFFCSWAENAAQRL
jgi:hypothetical protein